MPDRSIHRGAGASAVTTTAAGQASVSGGGGMRAVPSTRDLSRTDEGLGRAGPPSESESGESATDLPLNMLWAPDKGRGGKRKGWRERHLARGGGGRFSSFLFHPHSFHPLHTRILHPRLHPRPAGAQGPAHPHRIRRQGRPVPGGLR